MRSYQTLRSVLTAIAATTAAGGTWMEVSDFRKLILALDTSGSANMTIIAYGSVQEAKPDLSASASVTNQYAPISLYDIDSGAAIAGSTGIVLTGTDVHKIYQINTDGLKWFNLSVTARSGGTVDANVKTFNDFI